MTSIAHILVKGRMSEWKGVVWKLERLEAGNTMLRDVF